MGKKHKNVGDIRIKKKNPKKKKIVISVVLTVLIGLGLASYFLLFNQEEKTPKKKAKEKVEEKKLTIVDQDSNKRPIAVMIDNNVGYNSHVGLQDAYITYEIIVEGGLTRIMALFKDKDTSVIGPVRSSRHYFLDYALESDALYGHYGWSTYAEKDISALKVNNINGMVDASAYWRDSKVAAPHNVFTSIEKMYQTARGKKYKTTTDNWKLLNYSVNEINLNTPVENEDTAQTEVDPEVITASKVTIPYSNSQSRSYSYDSERKVYFRFMNNQAHKDKTTGIQYNYKNIIIEKVSNSSIDSDGRQDLETTRSGQGYYITNGYARLITWSKTSRTGKTVYKYSNGDTVKINDGNTFIQIEPSTLTPTFN